MADGRRRTSLLVRLLAVSVVVSALSVTATAYLVIRATTQAIEQEQGQAFTEVAEVYDAVLGYAATHRDWNDAGPLVRELAARTGHRIAVTDAGGVPLAESAAGALPDRSSAVVDPLNVDPNMLPDAPADRIDARAVGPYTLTAGESATSRTLADAVVTCLADPPPAALADPDIRRTRGYVTQAPIEAKAVAEPSGRYRVHAVVGDLSADVACVTLRQGLDKPFEAESRALIELGDLANACLARQQVDRLVTFDVNGEWSMEATRTPTAADRAMVETCRAAARREQLAAYTAPAALLFVTTPGAPAPTARIGLDLSPASQARILGVSALVLLVTISVTVLVGMRLVRPLHALTDAAGRMRDGDAGARVRVTGRDEIARLGAAFNAMSEQRQRVEELRRAMVGDIAHEMRTPVTNIRGWLEAAEDGVVPLDADLVASLLEEALLLQHVIADLQDLAAADAGELRLHRQPVEVPELLHAVADGFAAAADNGGIELAVRAEAMTVAADPIRLRQAIGNLVTNAIRHTPPGGRVTVAGHTRGADLVIDVTDTGPGIPVEQQTLIFERFWRAEKSRGRQSGGSGLGLSIVRKLAEAHGGTVTVSSTPGNGATFTLRIPCDGGSGPDR